MKKGTRTGMFVLLCIGVFILAVVGSAAFKMLYTPRNLKEYTVDWSDDVGIVHTDISYGAKEANKFDIYLPADKKKKSYQLVVYIHAGGFTTGDKSDDKEILQWLCSKGYVAAGINYTLRDGDHPDASVYSQSVEIKESIPIIVQEAKQLGYTLDSMAIAGGSAGGTLAMLYAYRDAAESPIPVKMLFEAVGPASFYPKDWVSYGLDKNPQAAVALFSVMSGNAITEDMIGTEAYEEAIKPISAYKWVTQNSVPSVIAYGVHDKVSPFGAAKYLVNALEENHVTHEYIAFPHSGHALQNDNDLYVRYMEKVTEYLDTYLPVAK
jgi:acetyl esterase/lipase